MAENKIDVYLVPASDAHGSEYVANKDKRQLYMSGFTGEASTAIIRADDASLFVDGRYHVQAEKEIDSNWTCKAHK
jgi:Xaa-Pro aminopeptidase